MKIYEDEKNHEDLLIGDFEESFYNMTMKDSMLLTWAKSGCTVPFIFKGLKILQLNPCPKSYNLTRWCRSVQAWTFCALFHKNEGAPLNCYLTMKLSKSPSLIFLSITANLKTNELIADQ